MKFKYTSLRYNDAELAKLGDQGWEAYAVTEVVIFGEIITTIWLKKRV